MSATALDLGDGVAKLDFKDRFESTITEDAIVELNKLCDPCAAFIQSSTLLQRLGRKDIKIGVHETGRVGTPRDIKTGYKSGGCHFCALLWLRAGAYHLDPEKLVGKEEIDLDAPLEVRLTARDVDKEYEIMVARESEETTAKKLWYKIAPMPPISEKGFLDLRILELEKARIGADLHIHHSSNPSLNKASQTFTTSPASSRHSALFSQIQTWQRACLDSHPNCATLSDLVSSTSPLPSRLLDVSNDAIKLFPLPEDTSPAEIKYTTLSHMWGPDPSLCPQLTLSTLASFSADIPIGSLPDKYAFAVRITRALGYRFIWIDSLCIIQDSAEDWRREALKMAAVYGRSELNVSYVYPPSSDRDVAGNYMRDGRVNLPCCTPHPYHSHSGGGKKKKKTSSAEGEGDEADETEKLIISHRPNFHRPTWSPTLYKRIWPLLSRGWVFQERLLCRCTVYFGQERLLWECSSGIADEYYGPLTTVPGSKSHFFRLITGLASSSGGGVSKPSGAAFPAGAIEGTPDYDEDRGSANEQWGPLVKDYRAGELTKEYDRGIAFAGIARAIQASAKTTYLAGLWRELFAFDLLWTVGLVVVSEEEKKKAEARRAMMAAGGAPSWSWFAVVPTANKMGGDVLDWPFRTTCVQVHRRFSLFEAAVVGFRHPKLGSGEGGDGDGDNSDVLLHDFAGMSVTLRARRVGCGFEWWDDYGMLYVLPRGEAKWVMGRRPNVWKGEAVTPRVLKYAHDDPAVKKGDAMPGDACMVLTVEQAWHGDGAGLEKKTHAYVRGREIPEGWTTSYQYAGIVVVPAEDGEDGSRRWKRIGAFMLFDNVTGYDVSGPFDGAAEEDIVLV